MQIRPPDWEPLFTETDHNAKPWPKYTRPPDLSPAMKKIRKNEDYCSCDMLEALPQPSSMNVSVL